MEEESHLSKEQVKEIVNNHLSGMIIDEEALDLIISQSENFIAKLAFESTLNAVKGKRRKVETEDIRAVLENILSGN